MNRMNYKRYWLDKHGSKHLISKMSDSYLINTIKMLERKAQTEALACPCPMFWGDMAQYYAEREYDALQDDPIGCILSGTVYDNLVEQAFKRDLI